MRVGLALASVLLLLPMVAHAQGAPSVRALVDHDRVFVGEPFTLTIEVEGTQQAEAPDLGDVGPFDVQYIGPTTRFSSVNGRVSTSVSHRYALTAKREGSYDIGPITVAAAGSTLRAPAVTVQVAPRGSSAAAGGRQDEEGVRIVLTPDKTSAYVGERIPFKLELYVGDAAVDNLHFPTLEADGFAVDSFPQPSRREEVVRNRRWTVLAFRSTATPLRPGTLQMGPATLALDIVDSRGRRRGSLFDDLLGAVHARPVELNADVVPIDVQPLPSEGRPADFSGAVGQFDFTLNAAPTEVAAGDPVTVHMEIKGVGNLESVTAPRLAVGPEFRAYEPTIVAGASGPGRFAAEQVVIPRDASAHELPAVQFSFFEPESGTYRTVTRGPIALTVRAATPSQEAAVVGAPAPAEQPREKLGRDIVYIKDRPGDLTLRQLRFYRRSWFLGLQLAAPTFVFALWLAMRRQRSRAADPRRARIQRAGRDARRRLARLSKATRDEAFYNELTSTMRTYLADKLDLAPGAVDRASVTARLRGVSASPALCEQVARYYDLMERARYAPGADRDGNTGEALELARALVRALERERAVARRLAVAVLVGAALLWSAAGRAQGTLSGSGEPAAASSDATEGATGQDRRDAHTVFYDASAAYRAGDYAAAAREYERLRAGGFESGALDYNLGNAYFKQQLYGRAILSYERARLLLPRDADVAANLSYARESAKVAAPELPTWQRIAFAAASRASTAEMALVWTVLWCAAWVLVALSIVRPNRAGPPGARAALWILVVLVGTNLAFRLWRFERSADAVVVASGTAIARFEPSESGKEYYRLPEGSVVTVRRERGDWVQISRADGLRAWLPTQALERIS